MKTVQQIVRNMAHAIGTENYTKHSLWRELLFTDGVNQLREDADCYWLIDAIASYARKEMFQLWELTVDTDKNTAVLTMKEDTNEAELVRQEIEYTDFPLTEIKFYVEYGSIDGTNCNYILMLPSER
jgi:hypothetical protein